LKGNLGKAENVEIVVTLKSFRTFGVEVSLDELQKAGIVA